MTLWERAALDEAKTKALRETFAKEGVMRVEKSAEHQPPLRPEAPKPAVSRSTMTMRSVGSALAR